MMLRCIVVSLLVTFVHSGILTKKDSSDSIYLQQLVSAEKSKTPDEEYFQCKGHGLQADEGACSTFYHCIDLSNKGLRWLAFKFTCPEGMFFDSYTNECFSSNYWGSNLPPCHEREEGKRISQSHGSQAKPGQALVVTTDSQSNNCEHMQEETLDFSSVKGQRGGIEVVADGMISICEIMVNTSAYLSSIKSRRPLLLPSSDTILYGNASSEYNDDLSRFQSYCDLWIGDDGVLKSLEEIYRSIKEFEPNFTKELLKANRNIGILSKERPPKRSVERERKVLTELTQDIKTCFNFSEYGYSAQAMLAFLMNDLDERTADHNDLIEIPAEAETEDHIVHHLGTFFKHVKTTAEKILNNTRDTKDLLFGSREGTWQDYSSMRNHRKKALQTIRVFEEEKEGYEKRLPELEREMALLKNSMQDEFSLIKSLRKKLESQSHVIHTISSLKSPFPGISSLGIWNAVRSIKSIWDRAFKGRKAFHIENHPISEKIKLQIRQHESKIIAIFKLIQKRMNEASLLRGNIEILENEIRQFRMFDTETDELMRDADSFMHAMAMISSILEDIENVFEILVEEIEGYVSKSKSFASSSKKTLMKLHFYMAIENLKWSWNQIGQTIASHSKGDCSLLRRQ